MTPRATLISKSQRQVFREFKPGSRADPMALEAYVNHLGYKSVGVNIAGERTTMHSSMQGEERAICLLQKIAIGSSIAAICEGPSSSVVRDLRSSAVKYKNVSPYAFVQLSSS